MVNGKGDKPRPRDPKLWSDGYDTAFGRQVDAMKQIKRESVTVEVVVDVDVLKKVKPLRRS